ncbi:MAG TPA: cytochrome P450, partial [Candidatus Xenobia bacterium]
MVSPQPRYRFEFFVKLRRHAPQFFEALAREHGDRVRVRVGGNTLYLLSHPDDVQQVLMLSHAFVTKGRTLERASRRLLGQGLLNSHGDFHLRQRHLMQPAFHRNRVLSYAHAMIDETLALSRTWEQRPWIDVHREMM